MLIEDSSRMTRVSGYAGFAALTLVGVMALGALQIIAATQTPGGLDFPRSWTDFREGRTTGTLERQLDQKLPARTTLIAVANSARYMLTGSGGDQVRNGKDGWLFLTDELRFEADGNANLNARAELLKTASQSLARQGIHLIVALVPDKARLYSSRLANRTYPAYLDSRYTDALLALRQRSVAVIDLLQPLASGARSSNMYYRTDTHWNQSGARVAAEAIARSVRQLRLDIDQTKFDTAHVGLQAERAGDLIRLMGLDGMPNFLRPLPDSESPLVTRQTSVDAADGLFGDTAMPVVLTGTSYSLRGNFHGFLQQALSAKVLNAAKDGGGFLQSTTAYLHDEAFATAKPKVLIWELPERFLLSPLTDEAGWLDKSGL